MKLDASPNSVGRWILAQLEDGAIGREELLGRARFHFEDAKRAKGVPYVLGGLQHHGLVCYRSQVRAYEIRTAGLEALARLRSGEPVYVGESVPNVRVFSHDFTEAARDGGPGNRSPRAAA